MSETLKCIVRIKPSGTNEIEKSKKFIQYRNE